MFFGAALKPGQEISPKPADGGEILHLSQACLSNPTDNSVSVLMIENDGNKYAVCALSKNTAPHAQLDLFLSTASGPKLSVKGNAEIHVVGYYEPEEDELSDMCSDEEGAEHEHCEVKKTSQDKPNKAMKAKHTPIVEEDSEDSEGADEEDTQPGVETGDEEDEEEDGNEEEEGGSEGEVEDDDEDDDELDTGLQLTDDDEDEEEGEEEEEDLPAHKFPKAAPKKGAVPNGVANKKGKQTTPTFPNARPEKRKFEGKKDDGKKQKVDNNFGSFEKELVGFLRTNGRTSFSVLGSKVKKPAGLDKLGQFCKERPHMFTVENGFVALK